MPIPSGPAWNGRVSRASRGAVAALAVAALALPAACGSDPKPTSAVRATAPAAQPTGPCPVSRLLVPACGAWWGAAVEPAQGQSQVDAIHAFERRVGRPLPIVHLYHRADDAFPTPDEVALASDRAHPRTLFFNWRPEGDLSWAATAAGGPVVDGRIDRLAARLRATLHRPFFLSITAEPENEVVATPGSGYTADDYRRMFRHVVRRLRADGVTDAVTVMDYIASDNWVGRPWWPRLYPGNDVVDWLAFDTYLRQSRGSRPDFPALVDGARRAVPGWPGFVAWAGSVAPGKPVMLAEWGAITDGAHDALKVDLLRSFAASAARFPQVKAYLYWDSQRALPIDGGSAMGTTALETPQAVGAFVAAVRRPYFSAVTPRR